MTDYTVGFMFNENRDSVVLIRKNRPDWQRGLLNGVGGHITNHETARQGMVREFLEEAGVQTEEKDWQCFCRMNVVKRGAMVYVFSAFNEEAFSHAKTTEDEEIQKVAAAELKNYSVVPNLRWLIPVALFHTPKFPVNVTE